MEEESPCLIGQLEASTLWVYRGPGSSVTVLSVTRLVEAVKFHQHLTDFKMPSKLLDNSIPISPRYHLCITLYLTYIEYVKYFKFSTTVSLLWGRRLFKSGHTSFSCFFICVKVELHGCVNVYLNYVVSALGITHWDCCVLTLKVVNNTATINPNPLGDISHLESTRFYIGPSFVYFIRWWSKSSNFLYADDTTAFTIL